MQRFRQRIVAVRRDAIGRKQVGVVLVAVFLDDVGRMKDRVGDLKRHFEMANTDLDKLGISTDRIAKRAMKIESMDVEPTAIESGGGEKRLASG